MASDARPLAGPAIGSAWEFARPGQPRPLDSGAFALVAMPMSPFWARRYTRFFLNSCKGMGEETAETAELLVSELVTNAVRFAGDPTRTLRYSERANASLISLSIRHFREGLLIEVYDTDSNPPVPSHADELRGKRPGPDARGNAEQGMVVLLPAGRRQSRLLLPGDKMIRYYDVSQLTTAELERAKRELQANLGLITPHSPAHVPIRLR